MLKVHDKFHSLYASQFIKPWAGEQSQNVGPNKMRGHHIWLSQIIRFMIWQGKLSNHSTLKNTKELCDPGRPWLLLGSKDEFWRSSGCTYCTLDCWIWTRDAKDMASNSISLSQKKIDQTFFSIYVQAMEILSTNIFTLHFTNAPYHQTISCSN